jgi:hypothetical protein
MRKEKKEKKEIPPFFFATTEHHPRNNSFNKYNSLPLPIPLNKTPLFFKFIKTSHLKTNPLRDGKKSKYLNPHALLTQLLKKKKLIPKLIHLAYF